MFRQLARRGADASKRCTGLVGAGGDVIGEDPPSPSAVRAALAALAAVDAARQQEVEEAATHVLEAELAEAGAAHVVGGPGSGAVTAGGDGCADASGSGGGGAMQQVEGQQQGGYCGGGGGYSGLEGFTPQWVLLESNQWRKRVQVRSRRGRKQGPGLDYA